MRHATLVVLGVLGLAILTACGGGGHGFEATNDPLHITTSTLPAVQSGDAVDFKIPLAGGCGGPYVVEVIDGALPAGVGIDQDDGRHHLVGVLLDDGNFAFTIKVTDTSCEPFLTTVQAYAWDVSRGPIRIVGAVPGLIPNASYDDSLKWPDIDALEKVVYGSFISYKLVVAGGVPPYDLSVVDDPSDADDNAGLPTGVSIPTSSTSFVGTPIEVGAGGKPFRITFRATDSVGGSSIRKLQWKVDTPPLIIANPDLGDGQAGSIFADTFQVVDGVPPFRYELVDDVPTVGNDEIVYNAPSAPTFPSATGFTLDPATGKASNMLGDGSTATYPGDAEQGPYGPMPSEGVSLNVETGGIAGLPRRAGEFTLHLHVCSTLVPNERGQHAFETFTHTIAPSEPPTSGNPAFGLVPSFTVEGTFLGAPDYSTLPEFEVGEGYNPDGGPAGLQLLAQGGVAADGFTDAPHVHQRAIDFTETPDSYSWDVDWDVDVGGSQGAPVGIDSNAAGVITVTDPNALERVVREYVDITVTDYQLPTSIQNAERARVAYTVGPDVLIITHSTNSLTATANYWSAGNRHDWNDHEQQILKYQAFSSGPMRQVLDATDLPTTHEVPDVAFGDIAAASNPLGALLSGATAGTGNATNTWVDLHRPTVVATGWWNDSFSLHPKGANTGKHADWNRGYAYYGQFGYSYSNHGNHQPSVANVDLPDVDAAHISVAAADHADNGIYTNGGRLYVFESANRFGLFVIREDAKIYVPFALRKNGSTYNYEGFGDGLLRTSSAAQNSAFHTVQMTVSPNGRFAAFKLKRDAQDLYEHASLGAIVLVSLTGEKCFGESSPGANNGATWKIIDNGVSQTGSGNRIQYASAMALTDRMLYFTIGSYSPSGTSTSSSPMYYQSWGGHYFMQYEVLGGASSAALMTSGDGNWTQGSGTPMQTTYHHHGPNYSSGMWESSTTYGLWPYHRYWQEQGMNLQEHGTAPTPFRCSADGKAVVFMAGRDIGQDSYDDEIYYSYAWVCYDRSDPRRATTKRRHALMGSGRGYSLVFGPNEYAMWGRYSGPTTGLEISDDGLAFAFVYNTYTGYWYSSQSYSSSSNRPMRYRDDVVLCRTSGSDRWSTLPASSGPTYEREVTANVFTGSHRWRFGALAFTANTNPGFEGGYVSDDDDRGLIFWAGAPVYQANYSSYTYNECFHLAGTFYATALSSTSVKGMLTTTEGGQGTSTYSSSSQFSPSTTSGSSTSGDSSTNRRYGTIQPLGGFMSKNRRFMYVSSVGGLSTTYRTAFMLVGLNVSTMASGSYSGHTNAQGDIPSAWPSRRGFMGNYLYYPYYPLHYGYSPSRKQGNGRQVMAKDTGWVFWPSNYQYSGPGRYYSYGGPPVPTYYYGAYGYGGVGVYGFNADVNGRVEELHVPGTVSSSTSSSYQGLCQYMEVTRDGSRLAYAVSRYYYYDKHDAEVLRTVRNMDFSSGVMHPGFNASDDSKHLETSNGRNGEAVAFSATNPDDLWYAFKAGGGNETSREIVRARWDTASNAWTLTRFSSVTGRMNTLYATR